MNASELKIGEYFTGSSGDVLQRIPPELATGHENQMITAINTATGLFHSFGPMAEVQPASRPENPRRELVEVDVVKSVEREYEFGIGEINQADDAYYSQTQYQPTGVKRFKLTGHAPKPHGQLWEPCPICGVEPVCLDCGYCENHCTC